MFYGMTKMQGVINENGVQKTYDLKSVNEVRIEFKYKNVGDVSNLCYKVNDEGNSQLDYTRISPAERDRILIILNEKYHQTLAKRISFLEKKKEKERQKKVKKAREKLLFKDK